jgi:hypothetical protein
VVTGSVRVLARESGRRSQGSKAFADLAINDSDFATWFRGRVLDPTGVDLGAPSDEPPPAVLVDWHA